MEEVLIMFIIYGFIGWCWETPYVSICQKKLINRGFLHGPFIPIYGCASLTIMLSMRFIESCLPKQPVLRGFIAIVYIALVASIWEYVTSALMEKIFNTRWWDYSYKKFNIKGRIALDYSIAWGIGGYILWKYINTRILSVFSKFNEELIYILLAVSYTLFILDLIITVKELIKLREIMIKLDMISKQLSNKVIYNIETLNNEIEQKTHMFRQRVDERKEILDKKILLLIKKKDITLTSGQKLLVDKFNSLLENSKYVSRFYHNYPRAHSGRFKRLMKVINYKRNNEK